MLYALKAQTGEVLWRQPGWGQQLVVRGNTLYLFGSEGVRAIAVQTGQEQWRRTYPFDFIRDFVVHDQTAFFFVEPFGTEAVPEKVAFYAVDLTDGENLWRFDLGGEWLSWGGSPIAYLDRGYAHPFQKVASNDDLCHRPCPGTSKQARLGGAGSR
jgi:outer membrane protein assembly factor BamB